MSVIKNDNYNRIEVNPLIEEHMLQMEDSEFSVSQLTGHITVKRETEYISKTKELNEKATEIESLALSVQDRYNRFSQNPLDETLQKVRDNINEANEIIDYIEENLDTYEELANEEDIQLNETDLSVIKNIVPEITKTYGTVFSSRLKEIGALLESFEKLDIIIDNSSYFENFVNVKDPTYMDADGKVQSYDLNSIKELNKIGLIEMNITEMDKRVDQTTYNTYITNLNQKYNDLKSKYKKHGLSGNYTITGTTFYT